MSSLRCVSLDAQHARRGSCPERLSLGERRRYGQKYEIFGPLTGPNGTTAWVRGTADAATETTAIVWPLAANNSQAFGLRGHVGMRRIVLDDHADVARTKPLFRTVPSPAS
jgi:hypothetical protein